MGFFGMLFWIAVLWLAFRAFRRWSYCSTVGPRGYGRVPGWYDSSEFYSPKSRGVAQPSRKTPDHQQEYIDALESRVSDLEERLDFTERLLAERQAPSTVD
jgi:hypothetical protein